MVSSTTRMAQERSAIMVSISRLEVIAIIIGWMAGSDDTGERPRYVESKGASDNHFGARKCQDFAAAHQEPHLASTNPARRSCRSEFVFGFVGSTILLFAICTCSIGEEGMTSGLFGLSLNILSDFPKCYIHSSGT